ncbi:hypothetical protein FF100_22140 [Methylobacterium terricola]|uniref:Uncharacterized protein n=1 Tax=Methylobacterium terricola TaxID=2583531 RepID=A0A5C4LDQ8_9HYPH|nr:hypothetical protein [Methylobacterium terricola]TNC10854.1 hypothetical protein FF100_22140 [Methylobacterium terricola]
MSLPILMRTGFVALNPSLRPAVEPRGGSLAPMVTNEVVHAASLIVQQLSLDFAAQGLPLDEYQIVIQVSARPSA